MGAALEGSKRVIHSWFIHSFEKYSCGAYCIPSTPKKDEHGSCPLIMFGADKAAGNSQTNQA